MRSKLIFQHINKGRVVNFQKLPAALEENHQNFHQTNCEIVEQSVTRKRAGSKDMENVMRVPSAARVNFQS